MIELTVFVEDRALDEWLHVTILIAKLNGSTILVFKWLEDLKASGFVDLVESKNK